MLSFADPAVMSLERAQRVQAFEPDGAEKLAPDPRWAFIAKANVTDKEPEADAEEQREQADKPTLPWRALEAIQSAKVRPCGIASNHGTVCRCGLSRHSESLRLVQTLKCRGKRT